MFGARTAWRSARKLAVCILVASLFIAFPAGIFTQDRLLLGVSFAVIFILLFGRSIVQSRTRLTVWGLVEWMIWVAVLLALGLPGLPEGERITTGFVAVVMGTAGFLLSRIVATNVGQNRVRTRHPKDDF